MGYDDQDTIIERLRKELENQEEQRELSRQKGEQSFLDWLGEIFGSAVKAVGEFANWLWDIFFGNRE